MLMIPFFRKTLDALKTARQKQLRRVAETGGLEEKTLAYRVEGRKFLHIFPVIGSYFNGNIIRMICEDRRFDAQEHLFVLCNQSEYESYRKRYPVLFWDMFNDPTLSELLPLISVCGHFILHANNLIASQLERIPHAYMKKAAWCIWGHDLYLCHIQPHRQFETASAYDLDNYMKRRTDEWLRKRNKNREFGAICYCQPCDRAVIREFYGTGMPSFLVCYAIDDVAAINREFISRHKIQGAR